MRNLILISCCAAFLALASCSKENLLAENPTLEKGEVTLSAAFSRGGEGDVPAEWKIQGVRMIVFSSPKQGQGGGRMVTNVYKPGDNPTFKEIVPVGNIDIYLIANEFDTSAGADNWNLASITSIEELEGKIAKYTNHPEVNDNRPIPMCTRYRMVQIDMNGNMTYNGASLSLNKVKLERIIAKTTLNLGCVFANLPDGGQSLTLESVQIKRMPKSSYLCPEHSYAGVLDEDFINGTPASISEVVYQYDDQPNSAKKIGFTATFSFYLPEYLPANASKYTYFDIMASPEGNPSVKLRYKLILGDGINDGHGNQKNNAQMSISDKTSDFRVSRNKHYIFHTLIKSYGTIDGMIIDPTVEDWGNPKEVDEDLKGHILNVSDIQTSINDISSARVYFWSNQKDVVVDPTGYTGETGTTTFTVNSFFDKLSGGGATATNFHYTYNPTTQSGTGYMDINVIEKRSGDYTHRILLNAGGLKREIAVNTTVLLSQHILNFETAQYAYVGTFHRHDEKGERLIRIPNITSGTVTTGAWTAIVRQGADWIRLDKDIPNTHPNNSDAELAPAVTGTKSLTGVCNATTPIAFRIGLTDTIATDANRYGVIMLLYNNNKKFHMIYVRQGEAADYVMRPNEIGTPGSSIDSRPYAKRISPYNLRADIYNQNIESRSGKFTQYPTQAGAYFQWNNLWAWPPIGDMVLSVQSPHNMVWLTDREPCPSSTKSGDGHSYKTPSDGPPNTSGQPEDSEIRQSFFLNPQAGASSDTNNFMWGYYADGFFDRRNISMHLRPGGKPKTAVGMNTNEVAYVGGLLFNPATKASIFIPGAGLRNTTADLHNTGRLCYLWSSTPVYGDSAWYTYLDFKYATPGTYTIDCAFPSRCVQE